MTQTDEGSGSGREREREREREKGIVEFVCEKDSMCIRVRGR